MLHTCIAYDRVHPLIDIDQLEAMQAMMPDEETMMNLAIALSLVSDRIEVAKFRTWE